MDGRLLLRLERCLGCQRLFLICRSCYHGHTYCSDDCRKPARASHLWTYRTTGWADRGWADWYRRAVRSRIEPLARFAKLLAGYAHGIVAHARWPLHTSLLEGINNKIKVIKRMAYGLRDDEYFFLKIRSAFPGDPG